MDLLVSTEEIKAILGISGSQKDYLISTTNSNATANLYEMVGVPTLGRHSITNEHIEQTNCLEFYVSDPHVDPSSIHIYDNDLNEITGYTFELKYNSLRTVRVLKDGKYTRLPYMSFYVSYEAGFYLQDTFELLSNNDLENETISITNTGVTNTYTLKAITADPSHITIGATLEDTVTNIKNKLSATGSSTLNIPLGRSVSTSLSEEEATITHATIPEELKLAIAQLVGELTTEVRDKRGGVSSYTLGTKSVNYGRSQDRFRRTQDDGDLYSAILGTILKKYKKVTIAS